MITRNSNEYLCFISVTAECGEKIIDANKRINVRFSLKELNVQQLIKGADFPLVCMISLK